MAEFFNKYLEFIPGLFGPGNWAGPVLAALVHIFLILNLVAAEALVFIWMERKIAGRIQDRLGPTRVGGKFGWLQTLADGIKLIAKEDTHAGRRGPTAFQAGPLHQLLRGVRRRYRLAVRQRRGPVGGGPSEFAVFFILAVLGLEVFGVILAGYSSASKWSLFGAMREAAQVVSYEVPLGMCVVVPVMLVGSMDLVAHRRHAGRACSRTG